MSRLLLAAVALAAALLLAPPAANADKPPKSRPVIVVAGTPPAELGTLDIKKGKGRKARDGDELVVHYAMVTWSDGKEKDESYGRGEPFAFTIGAGQVIPGFEQGLTGMREGGRRRLIVPPALAYGAKGSPPQVAPNETLVFVVDLVRIRR